MFLFTRPLSGRAGAERELPEPREFAHPEEEGGPQRSCGFGGRSSSWADANSKSKGSGREAEQRFLQIMVLGAKRRVQSQEREALGSSQLVHTDPERLTQDQEGTRNGPASRNWIPGSSWFISIPDWIQCSATSRKQRDIVLGGPQRRRKAPRAMGVQGNRNQYQPNKQSFCPEGF